jgi:hypothetical protein
MALDLDDCTFSGPALPEPFVKFELEDLLRKKGLLPRATGAEGKALAASWDSYRRSLRALGDAGGPVRVFNHVLVPLVERLGYAASDRSDPVRTREGDEDGGWVFATVDGTARLRVWSIESGADMDAPNRRGRAYRFSPTQVACRVLLQQRERVGLLTDGRELRLLVSDPAGRDSHVEVHLDRSGGWRGAKDPPDSYRLIVALASPRGVAAVPDLVEAARLTQVRVTGKLREQARRAVEGFVQLVLDHPDNAAAVAAWQDRQALARALWHEGLVQVYRLLFVLKLESSPDPSRAFAFASSSLWRNTWSPNVALSRYARLLLHEGRDTGHMLEHGLRRLFRLFCEGLDARELPVKPLGGMLFGREAVPVLDGLSWGERAVAILLDRLLWTPVVGRQERRRVYYGSLDVEDLGRVYESLLELEPGFSDQPMCRLRRAKLEVVVPIGQGERYRTTAVSDAYYYAVGDDGDDDAGEDDGRAAKTKVQWIEEIPTGRFFLRVGLGRKASGSYYTPHSFVKFLVRETLDPLVAERSPVDDPRPGAILKLKILDPAMGSGHFLVEAARFLGDKLYEACRLADEAALELERQAETAGAGDRDRLFGRARDLRRRVEDLPDPEDEILAYLPSRAPEGVESGLSQSKALALCRRLVAVHCLYGVDKNPLAVELAKLSLWIEAHAEGMPLTFLDHRLVVGDSLTGPFFEHLLTMPGSLEPLDDLFRQGLADRLTAALAKALVGVAELEKSVGVSLADVEAKKLAKVDLDRVLAPFRVVAAAWAGGVMLGQEQCDDPGYARLVEAVAGTGTLPASLADRPRLRAMVARGLGVEGVPASRDDLLALVLEGRTSPAFAYDLAFPEVFHPDGTGGPRAGFDVVLGNPPWEAIRRADDQFFGGIDFASLAGATKREKKLVQDRLLANSAVASVYDAYVESFHAADRSADALFTVHKARVADQLAGRGTYDQFMLFAERGARLVGPSGRVGCVLPSAFHANEGATGVRRLYLQELALQTCFSFENRRKLFEIHSSFKFALVVAARPGPTTEFRCAFYLHDDEWLFSGAVDDSLRYRFDFVQQTGGDYLNLIELRSPADLAVAATCFRNGRMFGSAARDLGIRLSQELNMTYDVARFTPTWELIDDGADPREPSVASRLQETGVLILHEGKSFHQFTDCWDAPPRYLVSLGNLDGRTDLVEAARYYRLAYRDIASSTNERTVLFALLPPGCVLGNTAPAERHPQKRRTADSLLLLSTVNTFAFDWTIRIKAATHVNLFILNSGRLAPCVPAAKSFLVHTALRLTCNHAGYAPLWREQVGDAWREPTPPLTWPVLEGDDARWAVRAAIDAVVADAYGLTRDQYEHVLSTFSHKSYPAAPALCLAAFDELKAIGLDAFAKKHDPYWDIPLNESLPEPVIDLPVPAAEAESRDTDGVRDFSPRRPTQAALFPGDAGPLFDDRGRSSDDA